MTALSLDQKPDVFQKLTKTVMILGKRGLILISEMSLTKMHARFGIIIPEKNLYISDPTDGI